MIRRKFRALVLQLAAQALFVVQACAQPAADALAPAPLLPPDAAVAQVLLQSPAFQAALQEIALAQVQQGQWLAGDPAWTATLATAQRRTADAQPTRSTEWELSLQRSLRLPGKTAHYAQMGDSRLAQAQVQVARVWREQARQLLELCAQAWREGEATRIWQRQVALLQRQRDTVDSRRRIGTAAMLEQHQAEAALAQAQAQAEVASGRAAATRQALAQRFPGLALPGLAAVPTPEPLPGDDTRWLQRLRDASVEVAAARRDLAVAAAQRAVDAAERRPDPTVALHLGRARDGVEQVVGLSLSLPFGGGARDAQLRASGTRVLAAESGLADAQRHSDANALQQLAAARTAQAAWQAQAEAARRLGLATDGLARGYALGEGSLNELLSARRLALEQQLALTQAAVEAWLLRHRVELEAGALWPAPGP